MKYIKMLGLAAVAAMALMAFGAGTASATKLCTVNTDPCPAGSTEPVETEIHATLTANTTAVLETSGGTVLDTCTESTVKGKTAKTAAATGESVKGDIETLTWGNCTRTTTTEAVGNLELHDAAGADGTLTATGTTEVTIDTIFGSCIYGTGTGLNLGAVKGGSPATLSINVGVPKISGNFACPATGIWTANYTVTKPTSLFITHN